MNWQAKWIWAGRSDSYVYARREFEAPAVPSAEAYVTCASHYKLYLNGRYVGRGPCPRCGDSQYYDTHDLSHVMRPGKNVIAAICHQDGDDVATGFLLQLDIHRNGDDKTILCTDDTWRVKAAEEWLSESAQEYAEIYDSRRKPVGWNVVGFDDGEWHTARIIAEPECNLLPRQIPPLKEWELHPRDVLSAVEVRYAKELLSPSGEVAVVGPGDDASVVLDFGMEVVGFPGLKIRGGGCGVIEMGYSEVLDKDGGFEGAEADRLILHGGRQEWQTFGRRAFRYVQLAFRNLDMPVSLESVYLTRIGYPVEQVSTFKCSDDLLNEIWRTGVYTLSLCMQDSYEERAGCCRQNAADARVQALCNYYCFCDAALAAQALEQTAESSATDEDCLAWIEMLHDYYLYMADRGLVTQLYPRLQRIAAQGHESCDACQLYQALRSASKLAIAVSNSEDTQAWHERAGSVRHDGVEANNNAERSFRAVFHDLQAFVEEDRTQEALDLVRKVWGEILDGCSCDGSSSAPTYFLSAEILGVKPTLPGSEVTIQPRPGDLQWAQGRVKTVAGDVDVEWHSEGCFGRLSDPKQSSEAAPIFTIDIEAPAGFLVALPVHGLKNPVIDEIDLTPETPERRARKTYGWGTTIWRDGEERDPYLDWLKSQEADPPASYERRERCTAGVSYIWVKESISTHVRYEVREG